jgi:hypothetical protein
MWGAGKGNIRETEMPAASSEWQWIELRGQNGFENLAPSIHPGESIHREQLQFSDQAIKSLLFSSGFAVRSMWPEQMFHEIPGKVTIQ